MNLSADLPPVRFAFVSQFRTKEGFAIDLTEHRTIREGSGACLTGHCSCHVGFTLRRQARSLPL